MSKRQAKERKKNNNKRRQRKKKKTKKIKNKNECSLVIIRLDEILDSYLDVVE